MGDFDFDWVISRSAAILVAETLRELGGDVDPKIAAVIKALDDGATIKIVED